MNPRELISFDIYDRKKGMKIFFFFWSTCEWMFSIIKYPILYTLKNNP